MQGRLAPVLLVAGLSVVLVGCGATAPARLSPPVPAEQLDLSQYVGQPCGLLRADRAQRRHLAAPGGIVAADGGPACRWYATDAEHPMVSAQADADHGLEPIYQRRASFGSFEPTAVAHYPAVLTTGLGRVPADGVCSSQVGVGDNALLTVTADYRGRRSPASADPCLDANSVAFEIIQQIRAGNP